MENIGVAVAIIIDDLENIENIVMSDDGTGGGIRLPGMLIGKIDGLKLMSWIDKASDDEMDKTAIVA
jgi:hypothetical protein